MAKKDKKGKKAVDNSWEDEIDTAPPADALKTLQEEVGSEDKPALQVSSPDDDFMNGGLLGAIRKNAGKKKKGNVNEYVEGEKLNVQGGPEEPAVDYEAKAPVAVTEIGEDEFGPTKKGKKGGKQSQPKPEVPKESIEDVGEARVKTKAEKEKEKKEKEKQKKKEAVCTPRVAISPT